MAGREDAEKRWLEALKKQGLLDDEAARVLLERPELQALAAFEDFRSALETQALLDQMPGGFFVYRATGDEELLYANRAMARLFACDTVDEFRALVGNYFKGIVHPEDYPAVEKSIWEQIESSTFDDDYVEYRITDKNGQIRYLEDFGHYTDGGEATGGGIFYVFVAEASDERRRQLEEVNGELRRRLRIIEGLGVEYETILYTDLDRGEIQPYQLSARIRPLYSRSESYPAGTFWEKYLEEWVDPEDRAAFAEAVDPVKMRERLGREDHYHLTYRLRSDDGKGRYMRLLASGIDPESRGSRAVIGVENVDEEVTTELEHCDVLETALEKATAAINAKNSFLSNISHDLRTPMNAVVGYTALARKHMNDPEKLTEYLDQIDEASARMTDLVDKVLQLSRAGSGKERLYTEPCDLEDILESLKRATAEKADRKKVRLIVDTGNVRHWKVYADRSKLELILDHLVDNGIAYTPEGGSVTVRINEHGEPTRDYAGYTFEVEDTGIGIDREHLKRIFAAFERERNTTASGVAGMGLGLTIVKSMVELMEGTIEVESEPDKGSRFTVSLSLHLWESEAVQQVLAKAARGEARILVAEDNEINRELCMDLLQDEGFKVETAENGLVALEMVRASKPGYYTLILMDIQMPVMDGNEAAKAIRALPDPALAEIPIVALSANAMEEDRKRSMESGMNAHLAKPFHIEVLMDYLHNFINGL